MSTIGKYIFSCKGCGNHVAAGVFSEEDADWLKRLQSDARLFCEPEHVPVEGTVVNACKCTPVERFKLVMRGKARFINGVIALDVKHRVGTTVYFPPFGYKIVGVATNQKALFTTTILFEELDL